MTTNSLRQNPYCFLTTLMSITALFNLTAGGQFIFLPIQPTLNHLAPPLARNYLDNDQALNLEGNLTPNALVHLNLNHSLNLPDLSPQLLATLPNLGEKSASRALNHDRLTAHERRRLSGFFNNYSCTPTNP